LLDVSDDDKPPFWPPPPGWEPGSQSAEEDASLQRGSATPGDPGASDDPAKSSTTGESFTAKGRNGQLTVTTKKLMISRKGAMGFMTHGHAGHKEIDLGQVTSVQFKRPGLGTVGYIQFAFVGGQEAKRGIRQAVDDENTILFSEKVEADFAHAKELLDHYREALRNPVPSAHVQTLTPVEQLEKLAALRRDGLLTDEEFEEQKRRLLEL
jgi:hypothetical protein